MKNSIRFVVFLALALSSLACVSEDYPAVPNCLTGLRIGVRTNQARSPGLYTITASHDGVELRGEVNCRAQGDTGRVSCSPMSQEMVPGPNDVNGSDGFYGELLDFSYEGEDLIELWDNFAPSSSGVFYEGGPEDALITVALDGELIFSELVVPTYPDVGDDECGGVDVMVQLFGEEVSAGLLGLRVPV